jgi:hypothetical protein
MVDLDFTRHSGEGAVSARKIADTQHSSVVHSDPVTLGTPAIAVSERAKLFDRPAVDDSMDDAGAANRPDRERRADDSDRHLHRQPNTAAAPASRECVDK